MMRLWTAGRFKSEELWATIDGTSHAVQDYRVADLGRFYQIDEAWISHRAGDILLFDLRITDEDAAAIDRTASDGIIRAVQALADYGADPKRSGTDMWFVGHEHALLREPMGQQHRHREALEAILVGIVARARGCDYRVMLAGGRCIRADSGLF